MKRYYKLIFLFFIFLQSNIAVSEENIVGTWKGKLSVSPGMEMTIQFTINQDAEVGYSAILNSPDWSGMENVNADSVSYDSGYLKVNVSELSGFYEGVYKEGKIDGEWKQEGSSFPLILSLAGNRQLPRDMIDRLLGEWYSEVPSITGPGGVSFNIRFELTEQGELSGFMDQPMSGGPNMPLTDFEVADDKELTFRIKSEMLRGKFKGKIGDNVIIGAMQWGSGLPFYPQILKKGKFVERAPGKELPDEIKEKLTGKWHGKLGSTVMTFRFEQPMPEMFTALLEMADQETMGFPFTGSDYSDGKLTLKTDYLNAEFHGRLTNDTLAGEWTQDGDRKPIVLTKEKH